MILKVTQNGILGNLVNFLQDLLKENKQLVAFTGQVST